MRGPATVAGEYLRATAANDLADETARPADPADYATRLVFFCAFELAVRRRFRPDSPVVEIALSVAGAARRHDRVGLPHREAEMLIRDVLGEPVPVAGIEPMRIVLVHLVMFAALVDELALTDQELDALLAEAEHLAEVRTAATPDAT